MIPDKIAFVDLETTGGRVNYDRIIEIGILRVESGEVVDTYQTLINPHAYVSPFIEQMTGISKEELTNAPTFDEVKDRVVELLTDCVFVAHNVRFDYGFLRHELKRTGISYNSKHFCTAKLSKFLYPHHHHHNLDVIIERFGFTCERRHRAFDDAKVLWDFLQTIRNNFDESVLTAAFSHALKKPAILPGLSDETLQNLPELPGVYIFYGEKNVPLYVGKSVNIKERVLSHFANDYESSKEMNLCAQTVKIDSIVTAGELGALLTESALIKQIQPLYNRQLRTVHTLVVARKYLTPQGYESVGLESVCVLRPDELETVVGVFKSKKQAINALKLLAKEYLLCEKLMGLEKSSSSCFAYQLGCCNGACVGQEQSHAYNARFYGAFEKKRIRQWPYSGPIIIKETNPLTETEEGFLVHKWCMLGKVTSSGEDINTDMYDSPVFDHDTYAILLRYLMSRSFKKTVYPASSLRSLWH